MKKESKKKNFVKEKILQASDISDVDLEISDRSEINNKLVGLLCSGEKSSIVSVPATVNGGWKISTENMGWKSRLLMIATCCFMFFSTIFILMIDRYDEAYPTGGTLLSSVVTVDELKAEVPNIVLPNVLDYSITNILLYRYEGNPSPVFTKIMMKDCLVDSDNEIILSVRINEDFIIPDYDLYADLNGALEIDGIAITYSVSHGENCAFAKFRLQSYEYYLQYKSTLPDDITIIVKTMIQYI